MGTFRVQLASCSLLALCLHAASAHAEGPLFDARTFRPPTAPDSSLYLESSQTPGAGHWHIGSWLSWAHRPIVMRKTNGDVAASLVSEQLALDLLGNVGVAKQASVGLSIPAILYQQGESNPSTSLVFGSSSLPTQALGDIGVSGKLTVVPYEDLGGFGLALLARVTLPTGGKTSFVGEGSFTSELRVLAEFNLIAATFQAALGFKQRTKQREILGETFGNELPWGLGVTVFPRALGIDSAGRWAWTLESHGALPAGPSAPFTNAKLSPALIGASVRYRISKQFSLAGGLETSMSGAVGAPLLRSMVGLSWTPKSPDDDSNGGVPDFVRGLPFLPDDCSDLEEGESCPDADSDDDDSLQNDAGSPEDGEGSVGSEPPAGDYPDADSPPPPPDRQEPPP